MKLLAGLAMAVIGLAVTPQAALANDYACWIVTEGYFSGDSTFYGTESSDSAAIGWCQNLVNGTAINFCAGQGDTGTFTTYYTIYQIINGSWNYVYSSSQNWRCVGSWPQYASLNYGPGIGPDPPPGLPRPRHGAPA